VVATAAGHWPRSLRLAELSMEQRREILLMPVRSWPSNREVPAPIGEKRNPFLTARAHVQEDLLGHHVKV
jgi:hypothetical protein